MAALFRPVLPYVLSLLIALTGQAAAVAHGAPGPAGQMVLCTGTGPVMVHVDAEGQPVGDPVYCPDFALSLILALALPEVSAVPVARPVRAGHGAEPSARATPLAAAGPGARGPPVLI
jgi:hypothetical protein